MLVRMLVSCCFLFLSLTWFSRNIAFLPSLKIVNVAPFSSHAAPLLFSVVREGFKCLSCYFFELFIQEYGRGWEAQVNAYLEVVSSLRNR